MGITDAELADLERLCAAAKPNDQLSMRLDRWIEWRSPTEKYSIAEFEHEADRDAFFHARVVLPRLIDEVRRLRLTIERHGE